MSFSAMYCVNWCIYVFFIAITVQANSDHIVVQPNLSTTNGGSGCFLERIFSKYDNISHTLHELSDTVQEQRKSISENQQQLKQTIALLDNLRHTIQNQRKEIENDRVKVSKRLAEVETLIRTNEKAIANVLKEVIPDIATIRAVHDENSKLLSTLQQQVQQQEKNETKWRMESQETIAEIRNKQQKCFDLMNKLKEEVQNQGKGIANDRLKASHWHGEVQTTIRANENKTSNALKENFRVIAANLELQKQSVRLLQQDMNKSQEAFADNRAKQEQNSKSFDNMSQVLIELKSELSTQRDEASNNRNENLKQMQQVKSDQEQMRSIMNMLPGPYRSCKDVQTKASGKYNIRGKDIFDTFVAYCEQDKYGGGWMVIQHRFDGSLSFDRNWTDYRNGFGEVDGEHWLGLERIHQFTNEYDCELLIEMKDFYDNSKYAKYSSFAIGSESEQYKLTTVGEFSGTAGDSLIFHKGMKFSTPDRDNDNSADNSCAVKYQGGWWFSSCYYAFLNGLHQNVSGLRGKKIAWHTFSDEYRGISYSRMMIRPLK